MDLTVEAINKVAAFAGVTRDEARVALEQAGGSPLDAVILLERHGRSAAVPGGAWSTRPGAPEQAVPPVWAADLPAPRKRPAHRRYTSQEVGDAVKNFLRNCIKISLDIWRGDDLLAGVPLVVCVLLFVVAFRLMLVLAVVGLVLRCRYHISGWEGSTEGVNRTMDQVTDTVAGWADRARQEIKNYQNRKK